MDLVKVFITGLVLCHPEAAVVDPVGMEGTAALLHALKNQTIIFCCEFLLTISRPLQIRHWNQ